VRVAFGSTLLACVGARRRRVSRNAQVRRFKGVYCLPRISIASDAAVTGFASTVRGLVECHLGRERFIRNRTLAHADSDERLCRIPLDRFRIRGAIEDQGTAPDERFVPAQREA